MQTLRCIEEDARHIINCVNLSLDDLRTSIRTRTIAHKKLMIYCYLRLDCGYSSPEIANYCHKDHTTILKLVKKHKDMYDKQWRYMLKETQKVQLYV